MTTLANIRALPNGTIEADFSAEARVHTLVIYPDSDIDACLAALNSSLTEDLGAEPVSSDDWAVVVARRDEVVTDELRAAYVAWKAFEASKPRE